MKFVAFKDRQGIADDRGGTLSGDDRIPDLTCLISDDELRPDEVLGCYDLATDLVERTKTGVIGSGE